MTFRVGGGWGARDCVPEYPETRARVLLESTVVGPTAGLDNAALERMWHIQDSQDRVLALAFR